MFQWLFKEFANPRTVIDESTVILHVIGGVLISISFLAIGLMCLTMAGHANPNAPIVSRKRVILTRMFGLFLMSCGFSRVVEILCYFHNFSNMNAVMKVVTGIIAMAAMFYIPSVVKESLTVHTVDHLEQEMDKVKKDMAEVKKISEKL